MAENSNTSEAVAKSGGDDELAQEIAQLKRELSRLKQAISGRAEDFVEGVGGLYGSAAEGASRATEALKSQAQAVSGAVRENPGTVTSAFVIGGIVGLLFGLALGASEPPPRRWYERR